jgi:hypothetical protein
MTPQVLSQAQTGHEDEALEVLLSGLLGDDSNGKCSNIAECVSGGCQLRNKNPQNSTESAHGQNDMAQAAGD